MGYPLGGEDAVFGEGDSLVTQSQYYITKFFVCFSFFNILVNSLGILVSTFHLLCVIHHANMSEGFIIFYIFDVLI